MTDADLLAAYRATTWTVPAGEAPIFIRLNAPASLPAPLLPAGIVTAYNPASSRRSEEENRAAQARLRDAIAAAGGTALSCVGGGTGQDAHLWTEPCFLVSGVTRERLVEIAGEFGQNAIVWIASDGTPSLLATRRGFHGSDPGDPL